MPRSTLVCVLLALLLCASSALGRQLAGDDGHWRTPPDVMVRILDAPPPPSVDLSPGGHRLLLAQGLSMPAIADLAAPMLALAGERIDPSTFGPHNPTRYVSLELLDIASGKRTPIALPPGAAVTHPRWSQDGAKLAFLMLGDDGYRPWVADVLTGRARALGVSRVNVTGGAPLRWMPDRQHLLLRLVPDDLGAPPERQRVPSGPVTQQTAGRSAPVRTYQDLLQDEHDADLFEYYATSQAALVDVDTGKAVRVGSPAVFGDLDPSPDGRWLLVSRTLRPYSYNVTARSFPEAVEVWDTSGRIAAELASLPLRDEVPIGGVPVGRRGFEWLPSRSATLQWMEALDGGDPKREVKERDAVFVLDAPFTGAPFEIFRSPQRCTGVDWVWNSAYALASDYDRDRRWTRTWLITPDIDAGRLGPTPKLLFDRSVNDAYGDPGRPLTITTPTGHTAVRATAGGLLLRGAGATPEGDRPFLSRYDLTSGEITELWRCEPDAYEYVVDVIDLTGDILTRRETPTSPPNYLVRSFDGKPPRQLTHFEDPAPELQGLHKELVTYTRADGVPLSATLYLPPGYKPDARDHQPLPLLVWAYPREFNDPATAGQVRGSPMRYTRLAGPSHLFMLTQGYAIMDAATMPIVGDPETMNDTFIAQVVASAAAAIDYAADRGVGDRERAAVGGHSYGAFMTANLLAHSDLFRAGIARSGAYNRTLTPFGFQSERRTLWEAPEAYVEVSPFLHAGGIQEPLLLIHGQEDDNSGTYPIQSERLYHALAGLGGTARLVMLPHESHGYRARESVLHVLAEQTEWLDRWVKQAEPRSPAP